MKASVKNNALYDAYCIELCTHGKIKLHSGSSTLNGNVLVCINGTWRQICGRGNTVVDDNLASVICSSIGYSQYGIIHMHV